MDRFAVSLPHRGVDQGIAGAVQSGDGNLSLVEFRLEGSQLFFIVDQFFC